MRIAALVLGMLLVGTGVNAQLPDHLKCVKVRDPQARARYTARLGGLGVEEGCVVSVPAKVVCVEGTKTNVVPAPPGGGPTARAGAFVCYKAKCPRRSAPTLRVRDQFGERTVTPSKTTMLCAPAERVPSCGNGVIEPGEQCDGQSFCTASCTIDIYACCALSTPDPECFDYSGVGQACAAAGGQATLGQHCVASPGPCGVPPGVPIECGTCQGSDVPPTTVCCESAGGCSSQVVDRSEDLVGDAFSCSVFPGGGTFVIGACGPDGHCVAAE